MNPPSEQLIRDYLNRMSVAAREKLGSHDRQALLDRIRTRIELDCGGLATASAAAVRKALAELGDPVAVVESEHARITASSAVVAGGLRSVKGSVAGGVPAVGNGLAMGKSSVVGNGRAAGDEPASGSVPGRSEESGSRPGSSGSGAGSGDERRLEHTQPLILANPGGRPTGRGRTVAATTSVLGRLWQFTDETVMLARHHLLEAAAVVLLGAGGAAFPPVWLVGACIALGSKAWDLRDKWIGLVLPVVAVIGGTVVVLITGGQRASLSSYALEAWLSAGRISRVAAVLGAGYLLWRLHRGPRVPKQPPWNVPHRIG